MLSDRCTAAKPSSDSFSPLTTLGHDPRGCRHHQQHCPPGTRSSLVVSESRHNGLEVEQRPRSSWRDCQMRVLWVGDRSWVQLSTEKQQRHLEREGEREREREREIDDGEKRT